MCRKLAEPKSDGQKGIRRKKQPAKQCTNTSARGSASPHVDHVGNADLTDQGAHMVHCNDTDALTALKQFSDALPS